MRLFVAIELSEELRRALRRTQDALRPKGPDVRWIPAEQLHLTVKFLGEVADRDVAGVSEAMVQAAAVSAPFDLELVKCGCFPERGAVRIVWAGAREAQGVLAGCVEQVEARLEPLGFPREQRAFAPHITMGRVKDDRSAGLLRRSVEACRIATMTQGVSSLTLMASKLSPKGSIYTPVIRAEFGAK